MKPNFLLSMLMITCGGICAASELEDKLVNAAKQLDNQLNYSWTMKTREADGSPGRLSPIDGKTQKDHLMFLSLTPGGIPVEVYLNGEKGAAKALEGWQTLDEIARTSGTAAAIVRFLKSYKVPAAQTANLAVNVKDLKEEAGAIGGDLKSEAVREMLLAGMRQREGEDAPKTTETKGSVKFWIKEGALSRYEINVQGKVETGDRMREINRTTTVDVKDVGQSKIEVPPEAKSKLS